MSIALAAAGLCASRQPRRRACFRRSPCCGTWLQSVALGP
jgi:hypothetical protein